MSVELLAGRTVLIVEDDFYLADDTQQILESAGAFVSGPVSSPQDALAAILEEKRPDCALLDVNLGGGPSFELAFALRARNIPFVFLTGYDAEIIPEEFASTPCLQKPVEPAKLLAAVAALRSI
ncbi:MAG: response regulator [Mesorhizobium sp.]|uniref:response regulator n=1 Tax=unclassified Mesorhizobium TaxID=325217 RepID=UPI000F74F1E7|nr:MULTISPECIES: response regulator [unclassified Mesorhizobium]TGV85006.1 response regulator [Mesorhizobium sp. M00.F.Ca.ET.158.01.1.1]AZO59007.1 response regulator [Mesorhizobium sp. M1A.F.Ca.IN.022.06.1.1]RUV15501.1 response regulator [Mesorhizobium sp. M1A.F.Ca.IN.022.04.1.1]RWG36703.1 MAG: response regulator [Mesorhizobium sp.]TGQ22643.1 response regulator [Mesorhizobium sp. M00.F.Ca.ET.217.01.1.1]